MKHKSFRITTLLLLLLTVACGKEQSVTSEQRGAFDGYFQKFETYSEKYGRPTKGDETVVFATKKLGDIEVARCEVNSLGGRQVSVDMAKWTELDETSREVIIFHELGHCLLGRPHVDGPARITDVAKAVTFVGPKSLMSATAVPGNIFQRNPEFYLTELFGKP